MGNSEAFSSPDSAEVLHLSGSSIMMIGTVPIFQTIGSKNEGKKVDSSAVQHALVRSSVLLLPLPIPLLLTT
jgi:hypothetical protein